MKYEDNMTLEEIYQAGYNDGYQEGYDIGYDTAINDNRDDKD